MMEISSEVIFSLFLFLFIPFIFGLLAKKINLSPLVGYLIGGLVLGNFFQQFFSTKIIDNIAFLGIVFLFFTIGLEMNFNQIFTLKKYVFFGGLLQMLISILTVFFLALFFNFSLLQSFLVAIALSSSSTSLVAKIIQERGEEATFLGELAMGILLFQDIAFIPFLIIFSAFSSQSFGFLTISFNIFFSLIKATLIIFVLYFLGKKAIPWLFKRVASFSKELLDIFLLVFVFFITGLSSFLKIPVIIGVFIAGILLAQTIDYFHIFSEVRPLRNLLSIIFFIYIGTYVKLGVIGSFLPQVFLFSFLALFLKWLIILLIFLFFRFHSRIAFSLAAYLFQIDEDVFILSSIAFANKIFSLNQYLFLITTGLIGFLITPIVIYQKNKIYFFIRKTLKKFLPGLENFIHFRLDKETSFLEAFSLKDHIIICGYGRVGRYIGRGLMLANIPFLAIDYNHSIVEKAKREGVNIIFGDPTDIDILDLAETEKAKILIIALPERFSQKMVIFNAKKLNPKIIIFSRVTKDEDIVTMKDWDVQMIIQPEFEASLSIIKKILLSKGLTKEEIVGYIKRLRLEKGI